MFELRDNSEVYCWLRQMLEPQYTVVSEPSADYFSEWSYCYRVLDDQRLLHELSGDFRRLRPGELVSAAQNLVAVLNAVRQPARPAQEQPDYPIASRLPPAQPTMTWFSSGRAAFAWVVREQIAPRRMHLPTLICWSLVNVLRSHFPQIELSFYPVSRDLQPAWPEDPAPDDALLHVHYFGHRIPGPTATGSSTVLEDCSHQVCSFETANAAFAFGSLRKIYPTADGGFLRGRFNPVYEPDRRLDAWLRREAIDWKDLREAENMTDRHWSVSDISGQSLTTVLTSDDADIRRRRSANEAMLARELTAGTAMKSYAAEECPLLHNRLLSSPAERDSLRRFLAQRGIFCSVHWPVHPLVREAAEHVDITDAVHIEEHVLSFPVSQNYGAAEMQQICEACDAWNRAGSAQFGSPAA